MNKKLCGLIGAVDLFSDAEFTPEQPEKTGHTCNDCQHRQRWQCGGRVIQYCGVRKSNRTDNGLLKIKCKDPACHLYKTETLIR